MKQKTLPVIILLMITVTLISGCNNEPPKPQAVLLNMGAVGDATGITEQMNELRVTIRQQNAEEVNALSAKLSKELEDEKASLGDKPSEEDENKIKALQKQQNNQILQARRAGNSKGAKEISDAKQSFVDDIMSVAQKVASEHGASIILKDTAAFWFNGSVDITNEVIDRMSSDKAHQPEDSVATDT